MAFFDKRLFLVMIASIIVCILVSIINIIGAASSVVMAFFEKKTFPSNDCINHCKYIGIYQNIIGAKNFVLAPLFDKDFC
jgi:hypothetical protein